MSVFADDVLLLVADSNIDEIKRTLDVDMKLKWTDVIGGDWTSSSSAEVLAQPPGGGGASGSSNGCDASRHERQAQRRQSMFGGCRTRYLPK
eukprot:14217329-Heterocapsa_arctica.AAC.1